MTIIEALRDPDFLGGVPAFRDLSTWGRWLVFLGALYGLELGPEEQVIFRQHTGRSVYAPPPGGWHEGAAIVGRGGGKTRAAGALLAYESAMASPEPDGTLLYSLGVGQDHRASMRALFSYAAMPFDHVPALRSLVVAGRTADALTLTTGVVLAAYPCRPQGVRGLRARVAVTDELAFFRSAETGWPQDREMLRALRPCLATTNGRLVTISSPFAESGALWDLHQANYGRDDAPILVWQATAPEMNPTLSADYLDRMAQDDPEAYRSEVLGEFRSGTGSLFDAETLAACVDDGVRERLPEDLA